MFFRRCFIEECIGVYFPDFPGCNTFGKNQDDAIYMARDALGGYLLCMEEYNDAIPEPTPFDKIDLRKGETVVLIEIWLSVLRDEDRNKAVKKTLTIPNWLNQKAIEAQVNFSGILCEALERKLNIS